MCTCSIGYYTFYLKYKDFYVIYIDTETKKKKCI